MPSTARPNNTREKTTRSLRVSARGWVSTARANINDERTKRRTRTVMPTAAPASVGSNLDAETHRTKPKKMVATSDRAAATVVCVLVGFCAYGKPDLQLTANA